MSLIRLSTARRLADLFWPALEVRDQVVLLVGQPTPELDPLKPRSALEAFYSHTHILDEFRHGIPYRSHPDARLAEHCEAPDWSHPEFKVAWGLALSIGQMWLQKLRLEFPDWHFRVYCTKLDDPIVRFHRVRDHERPWLTDEEAAPQIALDEIVVYDSRAVAHRAGAL